MCIRDRHNTNNHFCVNKTGRKPTSTVYNICHVDHIGTAIGIKDIQQNLSRTSFKMPLTDGSMHLDSELNQMYPCHDASAVGSLKMYMYIIALRVHREQNVYTVYGIATEQVNSNSV